MNKSTPAKGRIWEVDFLRGLALLAMVYFHIIFDLKELYGLNISYGSGFNFFAGKFSGILFIFLSGISSLLSRSNVKRGLKVFLCAICITITTYLYSPGFAILFGILHFLGISMIISTLFKRFDKYLLILAGTAVIFLGISYIPEINISRNFLFPFGIANSSFKSSDYYPLLPWFGIFLYGMAAGKILYTKKKSIFGIDLNFKYNIINLLGRHTLLIYLAHQPLILLVLAVVNHFFKFSR